MWTTLAVPTPTAGGAILVGIRKRLRLTQERFADELGLSRSTYKNYEYGVVASVLDSVQFETLYR